MEALFPLLAERYKRRSVMITSNLVFSQWNQIFHDDMTATAAIDPAGVSGLYLQCSIPSVPFRAVASPRGLWLVPAVGPPTKDAISQQDRTAQ